MISRSHDTCAINTRTVVIQVQLVFSREKKQLKCLNTKPKHSFHYLFLLLTSSSISVPKIVTETLEFTMEIFKQYILTSRMLIS